jgi:transmembrane sensor
MAAFSGLKECLGMESFTPEPMRMTWELLDRYFAGETSELEADVVRRFLAAYPGAEAIFRGRGALSPSAWRQVEHQAQAETSWNTMAARIAQAERRAHPPATAKLTEHRRAVRHWKRLAVAASMLCLVVFGVTVLSGHGWLESITPSARHRVHTYATVAGQRAAVTLPDGSRALLGPATTLRVDHQGDHGAITVAVVGQALFTVAHDPRRPFNVRTGRAVVRVLGTSFFVRHYLTDHDTRVVVADGRVAMSAPQTAYVSSDVILTAQSLGVADDSGRVVVTPGVVARDYTAWTTGELVFHAAPVRDIVADLGRAYGVTIRLADSAMAERRINWHVQADQYPLAQALHELLLVLDAHVTQSDSVITIVPGQRNSSQRSLPPHSPFTLESQYGR